MLSCIVQKTTGQKVIDYLTPRLFAPLGIEDITWEESPQGVNTGGFGLNVRTRDIARFALFLLNKGKVDGKQLLNPEWIEMATSKQISNGDPAQPSDWTQGYGFQFWRCRPLNVFRGDGAFGQYCVVLPDQDACLAMTSGSTDIGKILELAWKYLVPAMGEPCPDDGLAELNARVSNLCLPLPEGEAQRDGAEALGGKYEFADNKLNVSRMTFHFSGKAPVFRVEFRATENPHEIPDLRASEHDMPAGFGKWLESGEGEYHTACAYAWREDGSLLLRMAYDEKPFIMDLAITFGNGFADVYFTQNVGFEKVAIRLIGLKKE